MMSGKIGDRVGLLFLYALTFLLLWEWLRPLQYFTNTGHTAYFIIFIALVFLLTFFEIPWFVKFPLGLGFILFALHQIFYTDSLFSVSWIGKLAKEFNQNGSFIISGMWKEMSPLFRSMLFFVLLWLLVYLLHYWVIYQRRIFFFFIMTIVYITVLDTFTPFDASYAIVRIMLFGFLLLGLLYSERVKESENYKFSRSLFMKWFAFLLSMTVISICIGAAVPKPDPIWPDPVPFIKKTTNSDSDRKDGSQVGYGTNDQTLGGPYKTDDSWVFTWQGEERSYFRAETKSYYSGKGWIEDEENGSTYKIENDKLHYQWFEEGVKTKTRHIKLDMDTEYRYNHALYPIGTSKIKLNHSSIPLQMNNHTERIGPFGKAGANVKNLESYTLVYESPDFNVNDLQNISMSSEEEWSINHKKYLQLPSSLPNRVRKLAKDLTQNQDNVYDKTKAIKDYLQSPDFSYETKNVAVPNKNQDYVDQFLFETKKGYCDNFSSAMIVLLRGANIPARWVKGYTSGEYAGTTTDGKNQIYEVTNNNAHSWVEVYFKGQGWVTFEPTKGFTSPENLHKQTHAQKKNDTDAAVSKEIEKEKKQKINQDEKKLKKEQNKQPNQKDFVSKETAQAHTTIKHQDFNRFLWIGGAILFVFIAGATVSLYFTRARWIPLVIVAKLKHRRDETVFFKAYDALLHQLSRKGMKRGATQTLREFAAEVDAHYHNCEMTDLTLRYERVLYRKENAQELWEHSVELWENLIKRR
ncbi:DUF4129 domain-containing protein [Bacillus sp. WMMC1349]|uniref:DUF4129 domain-containing transglutaminase family protein n=1 Tax=Bacillus sp. WMMC1349 TaxID=2736254 RepID=UPI0015556384|nr:DUF4129 domain-containing transglutaminase family protein [Bacillus sp. WMMC1349]NPC91735.1 DUF4129 domain-containing protein [Bacillus sp. WMMC1349]